jgi:hypothetical protein
VIEGFAFRGHSLLEKREEYDKDFPTDNGFGNRTLDAFVRIGPVLRSMLGYTLPPVIRVQAPVSPRDFERHLNERLIFLLKQGRELRGSGPGSRLYLSLIPALAANQESAVWEAILTLGKS